MERYLRVNLWGPGPLFLGGGNLPGRGLIKVEKHWYSPRFSDAFANFPERPINFHLSVCLSECVRASLAGRIAAKFDNVGGCYENLSRKAKFDCRSLQIAEHNKHVFIR